MGFVGPKYAGTNASAAGAPPQTPMGELSLDPLARFKGSILLTEGEAGEGKGQERAGGERGKDKGKDSRKRVTRVLLSPLLAQI